MNLKLIDLDILETDGENTFDEIMSRVENLVIKSKMNYSVRTEIEKLVLSIERKLQDLGEEKTDGAQTIIENTINLLRLIIPIINEGEKVDSFEFILKYLHQIDRLILDAQGLNQADVGRVFLKMSYPKIKKAVFKNKKTVSTQFYVAKIKSAFDSAQNKLKDEEPRQSVDASRILALLNKDKDITEWDIELSIDNKNDSKSLYSLWFFVESLHRINGVTVSISDLRKGSIIAKIKAFFQTKEGKEEAEKLIDSTKKHVVGNLEKAHHQNMKAKSESEKIIAEKERILSEIEYDKSPLAERMRELELEDLELDIKKKRLEVERLSLKVFLERKEALSQLLAEDIISNEEYKLLINGELIVSKRNKTLELDGVKYEIEQ